MAAIFTRLALSNWRNFKRVDVPLSQRIFVYGPNASGKSNLLDAIRFLRDVAAPGGSLVRAIEDRRGLSHLRSLHAGGTSNVVIEIDVTTSGDPATWTYHLELSGSEAKRKSLRIESEVVRHGSEVVLSRPGPDEKDERLLTQTHLEQISQSLRFRPLADALASVVHVHVVPQVARTPSRAEELSRREAPGSDFIDQLAKLPEKRQKQTLKRIERRLQAAVPRFSELTVKRDELGRPHLEAKYAHWRRRGGWQNEQEFSDGTLRLVGLLWAIDYGSGPLLLEEPELSLHREVIRQLPRLFTRAALKANRQFFVSTHAEEMIADRGIDPSELLILEPSDHETKVTVGKEKPELQNAVRAGIPLARMVTAMTKPQNVDQLVLPLEGAA
ncbi:MAG: AAA family ATPase [Thermoanaerobaculia bacterium]|nr:AAA family ATPase [Thermoanaerobaculia bacterium]